MNTDLKTIIDALMRKKAELRMLIEDVRLFGSRGDDVARINKLKGEVAELESNKKPMYTKENLLVAKIAAKKSVKPELNCIAYYGNRTVATDSFRLMEVPTEEGEAETKPTMCLADTAKMPPTVLKVYEPLGYRVAGTYPDIDQVLKEDKNEEYVEVSVNGKLFGELLIQMSKLNKFGQVKMRVPKTKYKAIRLEAPYLKDKPARGLMMPMNK